MAGVKLHSAGHYAGNGRGKGTAQMNSHTQHTPPGGRPARRRSPVMFFAVLLGLGLLLLAGRMLALPGFTFGEAIFPILGGVFIAVALAVIVRRDRREQAQLTAEERNRQDHGMPR